MAPPGSKRGMGEDAAAAATAAVDARVDRFYELCSSEDRGKLLFKIVELELAASPKEVRSVKNDILAMFRKISADPPQRKYDRSPEKILKKPSPEEILKERLREEAESIEISEPDQLTVHGDESDDGENATASRRFDENLDMPDSSAKLVKCDFEGPEVDGLFASLGYIALVCGEAPGMIDLIHAVLDEVRKDVPGGETLSNEEAIAICVKRIAARRKQAGEY